MENHAVKKSNSLITGIILLITGLIVLNFKEQVIVMLFFIPLIIIISGLYTLIKTIGLKLLNKTSHVNILWAIINIVIGFLTLTFKKTSLSIVIIIFGLYILLNAAIKFINFVIMLETNEKGKLTQLISFIFYLVFGFIIIFSPLEQTNHLLNVIGIYSISLGITFISDFITEIIPFRIKDKIKRRVRITLPVLLVALIPSQVLKEINKYFETNEINDSELAVGNDEPNFEIFVHVRAKGFGIFGHVDIFFDNEIISYGNYDISHLTFFETLGDGVLFTTKNKDKYIKFCNDYTQKTIFGYGLKLNDLQLVEVRNKIKEIKKNTYKWDIKTTNINDPSNYAYKLYQDVKPTFYKFKKGKFKKYFIFFTNCVLLADQIIGATGTDILKVNGVITPGTYYDYLEKLFNKKDSIVVKRTIYMPK
ncbi:MAG: DUF308 domain-containing protein [Bacilli bacterium]